MERNKGIRLKVVLKISNSVKKKKWKYKTFMNEIPSNYECRKTYKKKISALKDK